MEISSEKCASSSINNTVNKVAIMDRDSDEETLEDQDELVTSIRRKRLPNFSDSDHVSEQETIENVCEDSKDNGDSKSSDNANNNNSNSVTVLHKSRLRKISSDSDSSSDDALNVAVSKKIAAHHSRMVDKRNKLKQKFNNLLKSKLKEAKSKEDKVLPENDDNSSHSDTSEDGDTKLKKKMTDKLSHLKSSICDPDTSNSDDDDEEAHIPAKTPRTKKAQKSTKLTSPKPMRMSAKEAMENMKKIKSESNRMLREKEVTLPYHRPKALSLKDIMSRRRPAISADGKVLPIKMNEEQLKQYARQLEERQKEMMELCKSESEEEDASENVENEAMTSLNDTMFDDVVKDNQNSSIIENKTTDVTENLNLKEDNVEGNAVTNDNGNDNVDDLTEVNLIVEKENITNNAVTEADANVTDTNVQGNESAEMELVYNDSADDNKLVTTEEKTNTSLDKSSENTENSENLEPNTEDDSQLVTLKYDTEMADTEPVEQDSSNVKENSDEPCTKNHEMGIDDQNQSKEFSEDELNMNEIDKMIENAEILSQKLDAIDSPMLIKDTHSIKVKPKLMGAPGMVIDLNGTDPCAPKKLTGVDLLKERFIYFAKLKTPDEIEREKEKRIKPGLQHLKLKQELEDKIAEQRSLEWAKRLEEEKLQQKELDILRGEESDGEDNIEKLEAKIEEKESQTVEEDAESEEEEEEELEDMAVVDKPRKRNPMVDDEAEESDCDDADNEEEVDNDAQQDDVEGDDEDEDDDESDEESSDDEIEDNPNPKKGRILKAFEDSDDETEVVKENKAASNDQTTDKIENNTSSAEINADTANVDGNEVVSVIKDTQDDEIQLAQKYKSDDLFTSQESAALSGNKLQATDDTADLGTQTFSILNSGVQENSVLDVPVPVNLDNVPNTQNYDDEGDLDHVVGMCSGSFSQNLVTSQFNPASQTQEIGEDVLALCTGKFYDNQFVSQLPNDDGNEIPQSKEMPVNLDIESNNSIKNNLDESDRKADENDETDEKSLDKKESDENKQLESTAQPVKQTKENTLLNSILDELNNPEFDSPKPLKYFGDDDTNKENKQSTVNVQTKKRFVIDSDDDNDEADQNVNKNKKKIKKKKLQQRALQISDDEEEEIEEDESEIEDKNNEEREVEYDSEENEIVAQPDIPKKKRKTMDFFEQEAELTSEDEWAGSGDEDERGPDEMEREAGDDDSFSQSRLQRELGQIHMRDVLDQDKREVRIIQELLFEDGDLGGGGRQRKFRWKNADGEDIEAGTYCEFADTQEEEFESEEQWRKQRHEREMFLKEMNKDNEDTPNVTLNRTTIIKANLTSKSMSSLLLDMSTSKEEIVEKPAPVPEKKTAKEPSPKKPFAMLQRNYHNSLLTRGQGALARLAALAIPLAGDDDAPKVGSIAPSSKRNFVFAALTPKEDKPKGSKRKAVEVNVGTPRLVKKLKTEEKKSAPKSRLLDHIQT